MTSIRFVVGRFCPALFNYGVDVNLYYSGFYERQLLSPRGLIRFSKDRSPVNSEKAAYYYGMTKPHNHPPSYKAIKAYQSLMLYENGGRMTFYTVIGDLVSESPSLKAH